MHLPTAIFPCALVSALLACGSSYNTGSAASPATCPAGTTEVTVGAGPAGMSFSPQIVNVAVGGAVCWTWAGGLQHNVVSGNSTTCTPDGSASAFCSGNSSCASAPLSGVDTLYTHTFNVAGDFDYFCSAHCAMGMTGRVHVGP
jgi:plastocyanin